MASHLAPGNRRHNLILLGLGIEGGPFQHVLALDLLGDQRPMGARLLDDALGAGNLLAGLRSVGGVG